MLPGETILSGAPDTCSCGRKFTFEVLKSGAGFYIGTMCHNGSCDWAFQPNSRESGYFSSEFEAKTALKNGTWTPRS